MGDEVAAQPYRYGCVDYSSVIPNRMLVPSDLDPRGPLRRAMDWLTATRAHRVWCMLAGLWVINIFDLVLTLLAHEQGLLDEANPVARQVLPLGPHVVAVFKITLVGGASLVLIRYRRLLLAEITAAVMLALYMGVAVRWRLCYELYALSFETHATAEELERLDHWTAGIPLL